jgi:uncharacterized protein with GYD domain
MHARCNAAAAGWFLVLQKAGALLPQPWALAFQHREEAMPIYITQGRYTREAIKGMIVRPEDRADAVSRLLSKAGGRMLGLYFTFGEYDFVLISEAPSETQIAAALLAAASGGGVTDLRTSLAMTTIEAKGAFAAAGDLMRSYQSPGGT